MSRDGTAGEQAIHGIDRMVRNIETGRFERSLSALTAAGALVTAAEIYFEHDSASFGNKMMWIPIALGPVGAAAGVAGFFSRRLAKTALPVASAAIVANGLQGTYLLLDQHAEPRVPVVNLIDARLAEQETDGWGYADMPEDGVVPTLAEGDRPMASMYAVVKSDCGAGRGTVC